MPNEGQQGNGNQDPWGRKPTEDGPPDLINLMKKAFGGKKAKKAAANGSEPGEVDHTGRFIGGIVLLLLLLWGLSGIFLVSPAEQAVVLRFGKYVETVNPGPHWIPRFIESKYTINVQQVSNFPYESEMLTKDENIVSVAVAVQFRIAHPEQYLFNVAAPFRTLREATSSALRQVVGQMSLDAVLTTGRQQLRDEVAKQLNITLAPYKTGLIVTDVTLQPAKPPEAVTHAFDDAIKAREDEQSYINKAEAYSRQVIAIAQGRIARLKQSAAAYKQEVVLRAKGDVARYLALLGPFEAAPRVTRERMYISAVSQVLSNTTNVVLGDGKGSNVLYLPLNEMIKQQMQSSGAKSSVSTGGQQTQALMTPSSSSTAGPVQTSLPGYGPRPSYNAGGNH